MIIGVVADGVTSIEHLLHQCWVLVYLFSQQEEGRLGLVLLEFLQHPWGNFGGWAIVEGEEDLLFFIGNGEAQVTPEGAQKFGDVVENFQR